MRTNTISTTRLTNAVITWDVHKQPRSEEFGDIYFSLEDPVAESTHVFLQANRLQQRFAETKDAFPTFVIGECGFGFGLNFLLTWDLFCQTSPPGSTLHFLSCELNPVLTRDLQQFADQLPAPLHTLARLLIKQYPQQGAGQHRLTFRQDDRNIILDLLYGDALDCFKSLSMPGPLVNAWYMDGFSPACNTAMWTASLCEVIAGLSRPDATLATYSAAGHVRENLLNAGFKVEKATGHGRKRHMLTATLENRERNASPASSFGTGWQCPWNEPVKPVKQVAVIGAGLAGCATAHALANKGMQVTLIDRDSREASGASGNPRGIVHFNPSRLLDAACRFRLNAYTHAVRHYNSLSREADFSWQPCGVLQLAATPKEKQYQSALLGKELFDPYLLQAIDATTASRLANKELAHSGLLFPGTGSLNPAALCRAWTRHSNIRFIPDCEISEIRRNGNSWEADPGNEKKSGLTFDALVICTNHETLTSSLLPDYPIQINHGQISSFTMDRIPGNPESVICHQGYMIPWTQDGKAMLSIGGCFENGSIEPAGERKLLDKNLSLIKKIAPDLKKSLENFTGSAMCRTATRCSTPDYLPLSGPVEDRPACEAIYAGYRRNARKSITDNAAYIPNLYINRALGSSGLTTAPLLGEYIASLINRDLLPLSRQEISAIHPLRFLIRELKRQK